ncbi:hypothetical protein E2C01_090371 [Portunus trituberculatus]|uniref:Uncharacterized protein n=1 Tax=Portunus trituberculatus TaxID=210409 RepID=A0A5B7JL71_PORTR|nr:hypothetical protein [Portunus trituberculatus]
MVTPPPVVTCGAAVIRITFSCILSVVFINTKGLLVVKISGNQTAAYLVVYKALSSPFSQPPLYRSDTVLLVIPVLVYRCRCASLVLPQS